MTVEHAREMRRYPTPQEKRLWAWLRDRRFGNYKFRRQHAIGPFIVDFYCPELKLAVEVDGRHHGTPWVGKQDDERTELLQARGVHLVRILNELFKQDVALVEETIKQAIAALI